MVIKVENIKKVKKSDDELGENGKVPIQKPHILMKHTDSRKIGKYS